MEEGIAQLQQGLTAFQVIGTEVGRPRYLALLAEAYGRVGRAEEGLGLLADAVATVEKTGEGYYEAELYRLKGELALKQSGVRGPPSAVQREAEVCFQKAIDIARRR